MPVLQLALSLGQRQVHTLEERPPHRLEREQGPHKLEGEQEHHKLEEAQENRIQEQELHIQEAEPGRRIQEEGQPRKWGEKSLHVSLGRAHCTSRRERGQGRAGCGSEAWEQEPRGRLARDSEPGAGDSGLTGRGRDGGPHDGGAAGDFGVGDGDE